eukprot:751265-Hanusia_phi.AAC.2
MQTFYYACKKIQDCHPKNKQKNTANTRKRRREDPVELAHRCCLLFSFLRLLCTNERNALRSHGRDETSHWMISAFCSIEDNVCWFQSESVKHSISEFVKSCMKTADTLCNEEDEDEDEEEDEDEDEEEKGRGWRQRAVQSKGWENGKKVEGDERHQDKTQEEAVETLRRSLENLLGDHDDRSDDLSVVCLDVGGLAPLAQK